MIIKTLAIEFSNRRNAPIIVGLHPGTVDTNLSKPFQQHIPAAQILTPEQSATHLLEVLSQLSSADSGKCFAWDGLEIAP